MTLPVPEAFRLPNFDIYIIASGIYPMDMLLWALVYGAVALAILVVWHFYHARTSRHRAFQILGWIEELLYGHGHVANIKWENSSSFSLPLRLRTHTFRNASLRVKLVPRELPLQWMKAKLKEQKETLIFQADLDWAPPVSLELQSYRMFARSRKELSPDTPGWNFEQTTPFILTTRKDWQKEITSVISSVLSCQERQFLSIAFSPNSPHFTATLSLDSITPGSPYRNEIFSSLRELATGASAPQV
jgi:hypothetical protein